VYTNGRHWTQGHWRWLRELSFENEADRVVLADYMLAVEQADARLGNLEAQLLAFAQKDPFRERVSWLRCFRGIDNLTAITVVSELHGIERFQTPRQLMAYLGLVPSENSTGDKQRRGRTGAGNSHVRRVLTEACHVYRHRPTAAGALAKRRLGQPSWVIAIADKAQQRLHRRFWKLLQRGLPKGKIIVALERELVGFLWAVLANGPSAKRQAA
jgi:transposase